MIEPSGIPQFLGNLDQLDKDISALRTDATGIRNGGKDVHSRFQALAGVYKAPEAEQLLGTTRPVMDKAETFAQNLETVADALEAFSVEARPLATKLAQLKRDALAFVDSVAGDHDWTYDEHKVNRHQELIDGVSAAESAFRDAENRAASKISAIVGGPKFVYDDGSHTSNAQTVMYGYSPDSLKHAETLPWGTPVTESHHLWEIDYFAENYVWDGFLKGGVGATFEGLGHLVGIGGSAGEAWGGLKDVVTGIGLYTASPYDWVMDHTIGPDTPDPQEEHAKAAAREFFKGLVAWDDWKDNPSKAAGVVTFNFGTALVGGVLRGAGKAGEAGEAASKASRAATAAANLITYLDPVAAGLKIGGTAVSKMPSIAELASHIRGGSSADHIHSTWELKDGSKVVVEDGKFIPFDKDGKPLSQPAPEGVDARHPITSDAPPGAPERHPVGVGSRTPEASAHAGEHLPPQATHHAPSRGSGSGADSHTPSAGGDHQTDGRIPETGGGAHGSSSVSPHGAGPHDPRGHSSGSGHGGDPHNPEEHGHSDRDPADPGTGQPPTGSGDGGDSSSPHQDPSEELPRLPKGGRIPEHTFAHVLQGELKYDRNGNPKVSGYHFRPGGRDLDPHMVKVPKIIEIDHKTGLTTGNVWRRDPRTGLMVMKRAKSTFFPKGWTEKQVRRAMQKAFENGRVVNAAKNRWRGNWKGITFEGYFDPITGDAKTIYPIMPE
ncbi:EndoU domain-containing protein [Streptomyces sp. NPDC001691]|uniref:EndoU domain-containing protein n=1 Tax=Streptomyces sp. NPDC001691 TaxID=3364600 RepID=UPI0036A11EA9